jgi:two-component system OmpR family response regulator
MYVRLFNGIADSPRNDREVAGLDMRFSHLSQATASEPEQRIRGGGDLRPAGRGSVLGGPGAKLTTSERLSRILYVDDDADIRSVATLALKQVGGFVLTACASGAEALMRAPALAPQLLLLDIMMPDMDGFATLTALRDIPCAATSPVIFMTVKQQLIDVERCFRAGALGVIPKPFDPMELAHDVRTLWTEGAR